MSGEQRVHLPRHSIVLEACLRASEGWSASRGVVRLAQGRRRLQRLAGWLAPLRAMHTSQCRAAHAGFNSGQGKRGQF